MAGPSKSYYRNPVTSSWTAATVEKTIAHPTSAGAFLTVSCNGWTGYDDTSVVSKVITHPTSATGFITIESQLVKQFKYNPGNYPLMSEYPASDYDGQGTTTGWILSASPRCVSRQGAVSSVFAQAGTDGRFYPLMEGGSLTTNILSGLYVGGTYDANEPGGGPEIGMGGPQGNNEPWTSQSGYQDADLT
jgi:hypothetical protein